MIASDGLSKHSNTIFIEFNTKNIEVNNKILEMSSMFGGRDRDEELRRLKEEIEELKDQLRRLSEGLRGPREEPMEEERPHIDRDYALRFDFGERISAREPRIWSLLQPLSILRKREVRRRVGRPGHPLLRLQLCHGWSHRHSTQSRR